MLLTLLFTVPWEKIVIGVIHVHDLGYHPIGFSGNGAFGCFFAYGLYEFGERSSCMNSASGYVKVFAFIAECMVDLISVRYHCAGKILQEFSWVVCTP